MHSLTAELLALDQFRDHGPSINFALAHLYDERRNTLRAHPLFEPAIDAVELDIDYAWAIFSLSGDHYSKPRRREQFVLVADLVELNIARLMAEQLSQRDNV